MNVVFGYRRLSRARALMEICMFSRPAYNVHVPYLSHVAWAAVTLKMNTQINTNK